MVITSPTWKIGFGLGYRPLFGVRDCKSGEVGVREGLNSWHNIQYKQRERQRLYNVTGVQTLSHSIMLGGIVKGMLTGFVVAYQQQTYTHAHIHIHPSLLTTISCRHTYCTSCGNATTWTAWHNKTVSMCLGLWRHGKRGLLISEEVEQHGVELCCCVIVEGGRNSGRLITSVSVLSPRWSYSQSIVGWFVIYLICFTWYL